MTLGLATSCVLACFGGSVKTFGWVMFGARSVQALFTWVLVVVCVGVLFVCLFLVVVLVCVLLFCCCCLFVLLLFVLFCLGGGGGGSPELHFNSIRTLKKNNRRHLAFHYTSKHCIQSL